MDSVYKQAPLEHTDSIRILELHHPTSSPAALCGRLIPIRLSAPLDFIAISYAWGNGPKSEEILLLGVAISITKTLFSALVELSSKSGEVYVWVDQICVNQTDVSERESQVCLMDKTFSRACQVIVWLGEATDNSGKGMKLLRFLGETAEDSCIGSEPRAVELSNRFSNLLDFTSLHGVKSISDLIERIFDFGDSAWHGAVELMQQPIFSRLWVIQEIVLSRDLEFRCGKDKVRGSSFLAALRTISSLVSHPVRRYTMLAAFERAQKLASLKAQLSSNETLSYLDLAHELRDWQCTDDRDRLNALAGIVARNVRSPWFKPSYSMSNTDLYKDFATNYIRTTRNLDVLHFAGNSTTRLVIHDDGYAVFHTFSTAGDLPSWTPDWRNISLPMPLNHVSESHRINEFARGLHNDTYSFGPSNQTLSVRAGSVDEIAYIGPPLSDVCHRWMNPDVIFKSWYELARAVSPPEKDIDKRFASLLVMHETGLTCPHYPAAPTATDCVIGFAAWSCRILKETRPSSYLSKDDLEGYKDDPIRPDWMQLQRMVTEQ